jgi:hypothetical protein
MARKKAKKAARKQAVAAAVKDRRAAAIRSMVGHSLDSWLQHYDDSLPAGVRHNTSEVVAVCSLNYGQARARVIEKLEETHGMHASEVYIPINVMAVSQMATYELPWGAYRQLESGLIVRKYIADMLDEKSYPFEKADIKYEAVRMRKQFNLFRKPA